ncbi:ribonuclease P protein component [Niabella sp. CC-SYL272]|uniref:ribonuclease P protein component n=1 Tax=Niabella agricola TaxID=2891571 RepID=UPI001F3A534B|nr:ribonuclease P protein component [Niabella agricola]MCF3111198.1 ribonuclease P protein component [Niabella agricola]
MIYKRPAGTETRQIILFLHFIHLQQSKTYPFPKSARLKSRKTLQEVFSNGKRLHSGFIKLFYLTGPAAQPDIKCGVGVSSRYFKKAVDRNRIKRLLREAYRLQQEALKQKVLQTQNQVSLFLLFTGKELPDYEAVYKQTGNLLQKLADRINEVAP